jgi:hypothetical protein
MCSSYNIAFLVSIRHTEEYQTMHHDGRIYPSLLMIVGSTQTQMQKKNGQL